MPIQNIKDQYYSKDCKYFHYIIQKVKLGLHLYNIM